MAKAKIAINVITQAMVINYSIMMSGYFLTSSTNAYFNDIETISSYLKAGIWEEEIPGWDKSSLSFISDGKQIDNGVLSIFAIVKNGSGSRAMQGPVAYELYWAAKGNAKNGEIVAQGEIPALGPGQTYTISYTPTLSGNYKFKAYQRPGHPGQGELWSDGPDNIVINNVDVIDPELTPVSPLPPAGGAPGAGSGLTPEIPIEEKPEEMLPEDPIRKDEEEIPEEDVIDVPDEGDQEGVIDVPDDEDQETAPDEKQEDPVEEDNSEEKSQENNTEKDNSKEESQENNTEKDNSKEESQEGNIEKDGSEDSTSDQGETSESNDKTSESNDNEGESSGGEENGNDDSSQEGNYE